MRLLVEQVQEEGSQQSTNKALIFKFNRMVWNEGRFDKLDNFLHEDFVDYSIPIKSLQNRIGMKLYLEKLRSTLVYYTCIKNIVEYDDLVICEFNLVWHRGGDTGNLTGLRIFRIKSNKILHHWEVID